MFAPAGTDLRLLTLGHSGEKLYDIAVTPTLRMVFRQDSDGLEVIDLVEQATLNHFQLN